MSAGNRGIEAVQHVVSGRGFAVVAEEVRKLAEDSNVAAKSIAGLAGTITSEIDGIVGYAQENTANSSSAMELSSKTQNEITSMIENLRGIANATQDLAAVAEEQAASSEEIAETVQGMADKVTTSAHAGEIIRMNADEIAAAAARIASGANGQLSKSEALKEKLSFFKLPEASRRPSGKETIKALPYR